MLPLTRAGETSDKYVTVSEWGISAPSNWYSHAILKKSLFSNTSVLFVEPRGWHIISLSTAPPKMGIASATLSSEMVEIGGKQ